MTTISDPPRKYYVDGGVVEIAAHVVYDLDADGRRLQVKKFTEYTGESVRSMYPSAAELRAKWSNPTSAPRSSRHWKIAAYRSRNWRRPPNSRMQIHSTCCAMSPIVRPSAAGASGQKPRASDGKAFFDKFTNGARDVLNELLEKYVEFGTAQFQIPDILKVPPISQHGNVIEIAELFGGPEQLRAAVGELQQLLYAA